MSEIYSDSANLISRSGLSGCGWGSGRWNLIGNCLNIMSDDLKPTATTSAEAPVPEATPTPAIEPMSTSTAEGPPPPQPGAVPVPPVVRSFC